MTTYEALRFLEEVIEMKPLSLVGGERLQDLELWDSLSTLSFIAMIDKRFGLPLPVSRVLRCRTVDELIVLLKPVESSRAA